MPVDLVKLFGDLVRFETELWNRIDAAMQREHGIPLAWYEVTREIEARADCRVLDIARALSITVGGASKVVDRVEAAGLCRRYANPADGRSSLLQLTPAGRSILGTASETMTSELIDTIARAASDAELAQLAEMVGRLRTAVARGGSMRPAVATEQKGTR